MREPVELEPGIHVTGQIEVAEEINGGHSSDAIAEAAGTHGIAFTYRPVWGFELGDPETGDAARQWMAQAPGPVLLYCRSGRRSTILWAQAAMERLGRDAVLAAVRRAGLETEEVLLILEEQLEPIAA